MRVCCVRVCSVDVDNMVVCPCVYIDVCACLHQCFTSLCLRCLCMYICSVCVHACAKKANCKVNCIVYNIITIAMTSTEWLSVYELCGTDDNLYGQFSCCCLTSSIACLSLLNPLTVRFSVNFYTVLENSVYKINPT